MVVQLTNRPGSQAGHYNASRQWRAVDTMLCVYLTPHPWLPVQVSSGRYYARYSATNQGRYNGGQSTKVEAASNHMIGVNHTCYVNHGIVPIKPDTAVLGGSVLAYSTY